MLVLDHLHQRIHNNLPDETTLHNGQKFDLLGLGLLGVPQLSDHFNELQHKLVELRFDVGDYICMKFLLLLNPGECTNIDQSPTRDVAATRTNDTPSVVHIYMSMAKLPKRSHHAKCGRFVCVLV